MCGNYTPSVITCNTLIIINYYVSLLLTMITLVLHCVSYKKTDVLHYAKHINRVNAAKNHVSLALSYIVRRGTEA